MMIYAIHKRTKKHRVIICEKEWYTSHGWRLVGADADGWIPWEGGECCPLPEGADYEVRHKDGEEMPKREAETYKAQWLGKGLLSDIIAYRPILDADSVPEEPEWDGEGLPPVGVECDCYHTGTHQGAVTVRYMGSEMCVLLNHGLGEEQCGPIDAYEFRPLRSEEDKAVEEMLAIIEDAESAVDCCQALYRAGYRKEA